MRWVGEGEEEEEEEEEEERLFILERSSSVADTLEDRSVRIWD